MFDNVFSQETCQELLHPLAVDHAERCATSSVFYRNINDDNKTTTLSPLEVTLDRLLMALEENDNNKNNNDNNKNQLNNSKTTRRVTAVEYWSRQEHLHMDVHCDVDEVQMEQEGTFRYPSYSHVLYLKLPTNGAQQSNQCTVPAPTCILLTDQTNRHHDDDDLNNSNNDDDDDDDHSATTEMTNLVTVPAVVGRLLRFPGNLLHAVPKPYDRWLDDHDVMSTFGYKDVMEEYDDDDDDDDDDDNDDESLRSVLLFNTWEDRGPLEVGPDALATSTILEGIEMDDDMMACLEQEQATRIADWQHDFGGVEFDLLKCNPTQEWVDCRPVAWTGPRDGGAMSKVRMSLMRKENRQGNEKQELSLYGTSGDIRTALEQDSLVSRIQLQNNKKLI